MKRWNAGVRTAIALMALVLGTVGVCASASAEHRVGFQGMFGFGGDYEGDSGGANFDVDAEATAGMGLFYEYELFKYFHFGANFQFLWYNTEPNDDNNIDRSVFIDIAPFLKGRYPLFSDKGEIYIKVPVGLAIAVPSDDLSDNTNIETGLGWTASVLAGFGYRFWGGLASHVELGWIGHGAKHDVKGGGEIDYSVHQFAMNLGVSYRF